MAFPTTLQKFTIARYNRRTHVWGVSAPDAAMAWKDGVGGIDPTTVEVVGYGGFLVTRRAVVPCEVEHVPCDQKIYPPGRITMEQGRRAVLAESDVMHVAYLAMEWLSKPQIGAIEREGLTAARECVLALTKDMGSPSDAYIDAVAHRLVEEVKNDVPRGDTGYSMFGGRD